MFCRSVPFRSVLFLAVQLLFQSINTVSCEFVYKTAAASEATDDENPMLSYGLYKKGIENDCFSQTYETVDEDGDPEYSMLSAARSCHVTSMVAGGIAMLLVTIECLRCKVWFGTVLESIAFLVAWISGLCVYLIFGMQDCGNDFAGSSDDVLQLFGGNQTTTAIVLNGTDANIPDTGLIPAGFVRSIPYGTKCNWGPGASYNVVASLIYLGCSVILCFLPSPNPIYGTDTRDPTRHDEDGSFIGGNGGYHTNLSNSNSVTAVEQDEWYKKNRPQRKFV